MALIFYIFCNARLKMTLAMQHFVYLLACLQSFEVFFYLFQYRSTEIENAAKITTKITKLLQNRRQSLLVTSASLLARRLAMPAHGPKICS